MGTDEFALQQLSHAIAGAIGRRDVSLLGAHLAPGFTYRSDSGASVSDAAAFLAGISQIPGDIAFVRVEQVAVDLFGDAALVTGVQHAQIRIDGQAVDDRRSFADFFVKVDGAWKLRAGADFPVAAASPA